MAQETFLPIYNHVGGFMLIIYSEAYCSIHDCSCEHGKHEECPNHPTMVQHCRFSVRKEELEKDE